MFGLGLVVSLDGMIKICPILSEFVSKLLAFFNSLTVTPNFFDILHKESPLTTV